MNKHCVGCGILLQNEGELEAGYTKSLEMDYCMRCFRVTHYHDIVPSKKEITKESILNALKGKRGIAFFFVDFLNIHSYAINYFKAISIPKVFVISKCDTIPKSVYYKKIEDLLRNFFQVTETILLVKKNSKSSLKKVIEIMEKTHEKDFYFLGMTNAGKSTFLNAFLDYTVDHPKKLTVSEVPNTTLDFIKMQSPFGTIYDSAGFPYPSFFNEEFYQYANVSKEIKPVTYPCKSGVSFLIHDSIRIELDKENSITFFVSDLIKLSKVYQNNQRLKDKSWITKDIPKESNVFIYGLGFIYIKRACTLTLYGVNPKLIEVTPSFMGGSL